jgi:archaellum component FlaF (FlaF/FlaG flagellin family)
MIIDGTNGLTFNNATTQASAGVVLQVVGATTTAQTSTTSTSFVTTNLTASITPKFSTSKILILVNGGMVNFNTSGSQIRTTIYRNSTNLGSSTLGMAEYYVASGGQVQMPTSMSFLDSPATTSSTSYTMYMRSGGGESIQFNADAVTTSITLLEIAA